MSSPKKSIAGTAVKTSPIEVGDVYVGSQGLIALAFRVPGEVEERTVVLQPGIVNTVKADVWAALLKKENSTLRLYMRDDVRLVWEISESDARRHIENGVPVTSPLEGAGQNKYVPEDPIDALAKQGIVLSDAERQAAKMHADRIMSAPPGDVRAAG